jgi:hypothetical protein
MLNLGQQEILDFKNHVEGASLGGWHSELHKLSALAQKQNCSTVPVLVGTQKLKTGLISPELNSPHCPIISLGMVDGIVTVDPCLKNNNVTNFKSVLII